MGNIQRRQLVKGGLWAVPVVAAASAVPAQAGSCDEWEGWSVTLDSFAASPTTSGYAKTLTMNFLAEQNDKPTDGYPCAQPLDSTVTYTLTVTRTSGSTTRARKWTLASSQALTTTLVTDNSGNSTHPLRGIDYVWQIQLDPQQVFNATNSKVSVMFNLADGGSTSRVIEAAQLSGTNDDGESLTNL